jgi:hypothetical protein
VCGREGYDPSVMPVFAVGHSLGCKLQLIASCEQEEKESGGGEAEGKRGFGVNPKRAGHLFVAFNNATAADSAGWLLGTSNRPLLNLIHLLHASIRAFTLI